MTAPFGGGTAGGMVTRLRERGRETMAGFSSGQKTMLAIAIVAVIAGGYMFMSWAGKPTYTPLFSNLSSADAASITQKLAANKVPYQLGEGGAQILVPQNDVYQQRLDMAAAGLPSSGSQGYSLLDSAGVTTSQFQQQVEYQQAVSDQLEKTIESMNGVSSAIVNVVIPQQSLFSSNSDQPSASVLVSLAQGSTLAAEQVQAIVHLVASSIEGLSPNNVTVVDQNGNVLNAPGTDAGNVAAGTMDQQETTTYEQSLDNSLQQMLATVLGPGNAVVSTNADLDFSQTQIASNIYDPNKQGPIPVQQASSKQTYTGPAASQAAIGLLGQTTVPATVSSSQTATVSAKKAPPKKTKTRTSTTTPAATTTVPTYSQVGSSQQNVVSEVTKTVQSAPGSLVRLSVAVVVNSSVHGVSVNTVKQLVAAAAGLQPTRGDTIQVAFVPFNQAQLKAAQAQLKSATAASSKATMMSAARGGLVALVVIALLVFALRRITKTTRVPLPLPAGYQPLQLEAGDDYDEDDATIALPAPAAIPVPAAPANYSAQVQVPAEIAALGEMIEREPERIAEMLRSWLETNS
ncbi:MAG TPA: flagellar basal-body MS-ring/collar protein FliF [Acidimicrobiales bacterium]|nr:flagellar basal-body MS-ring/collar protein FliF [Acidimicrobiales bacterium]